LIVARRGRAGSRFEVQDSRCGGLGSRGAEGKTGGFPVSFLRLGCAWHRAAD
jgi:hypothetical protein